MSARSIFLVGILAVVLCGCTPPADRPGAQATITTDEFSKTVDIVGPMERDNPFAGVARFYNLVTHVDKATHAYLHVVAVLASYDGDPIFFQFASDDTARDLRLYPTSVPRRACADCNRAETFNIVVPDAALRSHAATGYRIKVTSRAGDFIVLTISPAMIAAQYAKLDLFLKTGAVDTN